MLSGKSFFSFFKRPGCAIFAIMRLGECQFRALRFISDAIADLLLSSLTICVFFYFLSAAALSKHFWG